MAKTFKGKCKAKKGSRVFLLSFFGGEGEGVGVFWGPTQIFPGITE